MENITIDDIRNMSDEEVHELNKKLAKKAISRFLGFMVLKWALIFGSIYISRKFLEKSK